MTNSVIFDTGLTAHQLRRVRAIIKNHATINAGIKVDGKCTYTICMRKGKMTKTLALHFGIIIGAVQVSL